VLKQRVITAVVMVLFLGSCIALLSELAIALLFAALILVAAWEWSAMAGLSAFFGRLLFVLSCGLLFFVSAIYSQLLGAELNIERVRDIVGLGCLWWAVALLWVRSYPASVPLWGSAFVRVLMGFLTLVPAWLALVFLRSQQHGIELIVILIGLVAAADIGAYFSGRAWGKAKLAPAVSPGKSWAGFWGGLAASSLFSALIWFTWGQDKVSLFAATAIAVVTSLASVLGDLLESMVKRQQGIKDSGTILPGHGGVMDRFDSLTAASPVFALSLILIGW
jgi:phosphatidate cytidylyltransferase